MYLQVLSCLEYKNFLNVKLYTDFDKGMDIRIPLYRNQNIRTLANAYFMCVRVCRKTFLTHHTNKKADNLNDPPSHVYMYQNKLCIH